MADGGTCEQRRTQKKKRKKPTHQTEDSLNRPAAFTMSWENILRSKTQITRLKYRVYFSKAHRLFSYQFLNPVLL